MTAIDKTPTNKNFLSPLNFQFQLKRAPYLNFFIQSINIPGVNFLVDAPLNEGFYVVDQYSVTGPIDLAIPNGACTMPSATASASPAPTPNLGSKVSELSTENVMGKLAEEMQQAIATVSNSVTNVTKSVQQAAPKKIPAVRNQEETFQRMILNNTRVV